MAEDLRREIDYFGLQHAVTLTGFIDDETRDQLTPWQM